MRTSKFDFRNSANLHSLLPVPLLSSPFSSAQDGFKNQPKIFVELSVLWKPKTCPKGTVARDFLPLIYVFMNRPDSMAKNMPNIAEVKLSSCGLEVADFRKNCDCGIAELQLRSNISLKRCGSASFKLWNYNCGLKKKLCMPTSGICFQQQ